MEQEKKNQNQNGAQELSVGDQIKVRREKLANLQAEGHNPFEITKFVQTTNSREIRENFDAMEGKPVSIAGRMMSKRGMGKVSFCDLQDKEGRIQLYARKDEMDEDDYNRFKKYDIGDIIGIEGEVFRTQRGEMSVRAKHITLLSKSAAGEVPRSDRQGNPLPSALCRPHRQPRGQAELRHPLAVHQASARLSRQHGIH